VLHKCCGITTSVQIFLVVRHHYILAILNAGWQVGIRSHACAGAVTSIFLQHGSCVCASEVLASTADHLSAAYPEIKPPPSALLLYVGGGISSGLL
jgi:hypothetical protein